MQYGDFDDAAREYVITNPCTPVKWINYVGTLAFGGFVDHTGGALICKGDPATNRITRYVAMQPAGDFRAPRCTFACGRGTGGRRSPHSSSRASSRWMRMPVMSGWDTRGSSRRRMACVSMRPFSFPRNNPDWSSTSASPISGRLRWRWMQSPWWSTRTSTRSSSSQTRTGSPRQCRAGRYRPRTGAACCTNTRS